MRTSRIQPQSLTELGRQLTRYCKSLPEPARSKIRVASRNGCVFLVLQNGSKLHVSIDANTASIAGAKLPQFAVGLNGFETRTESMPESCRIAFYPKNKLKRAGSSTKATFSARVNAFFDSVASQLHDAALKNILKAPSEFETIVSALEQPEVAASVRDSDPLALARLRGIEVKRRVFTENGGLLSAEKVADALTISRQAVEKRRKAGKLIGVSLGRRGFGYPVWQFNEAGVLPGLEKVLTTMEGSDGWTKTAFLTSPNSALNGRKPLDRLQDGKLDEVIRAARSYGEQGAR